MGQKDLVQGEANWNFLGSLSNPSGKKQVMGEQVARKEALGKR